MEWMDRAADGGGVPAQLRADLAAAIYRLVEAAPAATRQVGALRVRHGAREWRGAADRAQP